MQQEDQRQASQPRQSRTTEDTQTLRQTMTSTQASSSPLRQLHSEESWVEIGSRPSSSSLSSTNEEIITTGLRVQHDSNLHRRQRRRSRGTGQFVIGTGHRTTSAGGGSSQEEYDESESESDRVMTSSNEGLRPSPLHHELRRPSRTPHSVVYSESMSERESHDEEDDDDENATAVNYPRSSRRQFQPRPNAFSHPPSTNSAGAHASYPSRRPAARPSSQRHSYPTHSPYNAISPHYQADHDEALRASLSTLLSAAAAVRGLPKPGQTCVNQSQPSARIEPNSLRLVPESVALGEATKASNSTSPPSPTSASPSDKSKRKAVPPTSTRSNSKDRRTIKKARRTGPLIEEISPTFLTWVVSAGVVVLVSALSFSAGYMVGKEAGHAEAIGQLGSMGGDAGNCSKEAASGLGRAGMGGLKKIRWTGGSGVRV